jgi:hypothetical protein
MIYTDERSILQGNRMSCATKKLFPLLMLGMLISSHQIQSMEKKSWALFGGGLLCGMTFCASINYFWKRMYPQQPENYYMFNKPQRQECGGTTLIMLPKEKIAYEVTRNFKAELIGEKWEINFAANNAPKNIIVFDPTTQEARYKKPEDVAPCKQQ